MVSKITLMIETKEDGLVGDVDCQIGNYFYSGAEPRVFCVWEQMRAEDRELIRKAMKTIRRVHANLKRRMIKQSPEMTGCCHLAGEGWVEAEDVDRRSEGRR
jgi:hypothetical protein